MAFPFPQTTGNQTNNPIEDSITSFNSNPYFIGSMMLLLNLGGRHLATGLTPEQDKFFQNDWFRKVLIFVVFFIGTRNIISSLFMAIIFILVVYYLLNDKSSLYLFKPSVPKVEVKVEPVKTATATAPIYTGLTAEESDIHKRLTEKIERTRKEEEVKVPIGQNIQTQITNTYYNAMARF
jgi:hypothetical protein